MNKDLFISGSLVVTRDENQRVKVIQFLPDDEMTPVLEQPSKTSGQLQLLRNASFDYLSGTRDKAWQLTLKVFASEGIDWQKAFVEEPIELIADLIGTERMREILSEALKRIEAKDLEEKNWKPFGVEW